MIRPSVEEIRQRLAALADLHNPALKDVRPAHFSIPPRRERARPAGGGDFRFEVPDAN